MTTLDVLAGLVPASSKACPVEVKLSLVTKNGVRDRSPVSLALERNSYSAPSKIIITQPSTANQL
jgi:hypothetical protein